MRKKALVIGVSKYDILDQLNFCKKDGQQVYDTLKMNGYEILADHILISDKLSFLDMHDTIIKFFKHSPTDAGDTLVFYFSGHAVPDENFNIYLASSETDPDVPSLRGFSFDELTNAMNQSISKRIVTILDCCHSGELKLGKGDEKSVVSMAATIIDDKSRSLEQGEGKCLLSASLGSQRAYELQEKGISLFTYYLLQGLEGNAETVNAKGDVTVYSLGKYLYEQLVRIPEDKRANQKPTVKYEGGGDIILAHYPDKIREVNTESEILLKFLQDENVEDFNNKRIQNPDLIIQLPQVDLYGKKLIGVNLSNANLKGANLEETQLEKANLKGANLEKANIENAILNRANLEKANLVRAILRRSKFDHALFSEANLESADCCMAQFLEANLANAKLDKCSLIDAQLKKANLEMASLRDADLERANLTEATLKRVSFYDAKLREAKFTNANLRRADFHGADLRKTDFGGANLQKAILSENDLAGANFGGADLMGAQYYLFMNSPLTKEEAESRGAIVT